MRFRVLFETEKLPVIYRHRVVALFKEALKRTDPELKESFYGSSVPKPFTFNISLPPGYRVVKRPVQIDGEFTPEKFPVLREVPVFEFEGGAPLSLWISSSDYRFLISLFNGLMTLKEFSFSGNEEMLVGGERLIWKIKRVFPLRDRPVTKSEVTVKTCSPILIERKEGGKKVPVTVDSPEFSEAFTTLTEKIFKTLHGRAPKQPITLKPIKAKSKKIKHTFKAFREKTGLPIMTLTVNEGFFKLTGDSEDLSLLVMTGLGARTGEGFGMVEVIG